MSKTLIPDTPPLLPSIDVDEVTKEEIKVLVYEEAQVIVHCTLSAPGADMIRIWKTTFLVAKASGHRSKLIHAENITVHPVWMQICPGKPTCFTLFFTRLPKDCSEFDLVEEIPEAGGFEARNITRNASDVYSVLLQ